MFKEGVRLHLVLKILDRFNELDLDLDRDRVQKGNVRFLQKKNCNNYVRRRPNNQKQANYDAVEWLPILSLRTLLVLKIWPAKFQYAV